MAKLAMTNARFVVLTNSAFLCLLYEFLECRGLGYNEYGVQDAWQNRYNFTHENH
jgi:hypothetical protein